MPKKWPNLESLLKNEGKAISWRGSNGKIFHLALGNTSNRPQKGAIYNCCLAVYGPLSVCQSGLFSPSTSSLPRVLSVICLYNALSVGREWVSIWTRRKDADLTARLLWSSSEGFRGVTVGKQAGNYALDTVVSFFFPPHLLSLSQDTEASELFALLQKKRQTQAEVRAHRITYEVQYLVWPFPSSNSSSYWRKNVARSRRSDFTSTLLWYK